MSEPNASTARQGRDLASWVDRAVLQLAIHWLAVFNLFWGLYAGLPLLAPLMMNAGLSGPAKVIYTLYRPACHQRPERSFFIGGPQAAYSTEELAAAGVETDPFARAIGSEAVGWKLAFCERDTGIYGTLFLAGLAFAVFRQRWGARPMRFWAFLLFVVPMGVDGTLQLFGVYESTWVVRALTGALFGLGAVLFAYPHLEQGFGDVRRSLQRKTVAG